MKTRRLFLIVVLLALIVPLSAQLAIGKKVSCDQIGKGVGYFLFFYRDVPMLEKLNEAAVPVVQAMVHKALQEKVSALPGTAVDLSAPPAGLQSSQAIKLGLGGATYSTQAKPFAEAMKKAGVGYSYALIFYTTNLGPKDVSKPLSTAMEELPSIDLNDNGNTIKVFNFIDIKLGILDATGKDVASSKELIFSYRDWFNKKYPEFMSGQTDKLPEGVDYNSASQYALFISESMQTLFDALPEHKALTSCPKEPK